MCAVRIVLSVALVTLLSACVDGSIPEGAMTVAESKEAMGDYATVCGKVSSGAQFKQAPDQPTFINLGKPFPNQEFTILILGQFIDQFDEPVVRLKDKVVCVTGNIEDAQGIPLINVSEPQQIVVLR